MTDMLVKELIGRVASTNGGHRYGVIEDVVFDTDTGEIKYLLIRADRPIPGMRLDPRGREVVSFSTLKVFEDDVIFS